MNSCLGQYFLQAFLPTAATVEQDLQTEGVSQLKVVGYRIHEKEKDNLLCWYLSNSHTSAGCTQVKCELANEDKPIRKPVLANTSQQSAELHAAKAQLHLPKLHQGCSINTLPRSDNHPQCRRTALHQMNHTRLGGQSNYSAGTAAAFSHFANPF